MQAVGVAGVMVMRIHGFVFSVVQPIVGVGVR
jgi:hypothetical protein